MIHSDKKLPDFWQNQKYVKNMLIHNQRYLGAYIKKINDSDENIIKVINITGQYFYGFNQSGKPLIIDVFKEQIEEVFFDECDYCSQLTPTKNLINSTNLEDSDLEGCICDNCFEQFS